MPIFRANNNENYVNVNLIDPYPSIDYGDPNNYRQLEKGPKVSIYAPENISPYQPKPLSEFRTDLTYLKFSRDSYSGRPYIVFPIPPPKLSPMNPSKVGATIAPIPPEINQYYLTNRSSIDARTAINQDNTSISSRIDAQRVSGFLSSPSGKLFLKKQAGLQLMNPAIQTSTGFNIGDSINTFFNNVRTFSISKNTAALENTVLENTRLYNPKSLLTQVSIAGSGLHVVRHGNFLFSTNGNYADTISNQMLLDSSANRLVTLANLKVYETPTLGNISAINQSKISLNPFVLQSYEGGPNSAFGIGNTTIMRTTFSDSLARKIQSYRSAIVMTYEQIANQKLNNTVNDRRTKEIQDFVTFEKVDDREQIYSLTRDGVLDKIEDGGMTSGSSGDPWSSSVPDMINFGFECINNDNPSTSDFLQFRAYLSNAISDNNQASLSTFKYLGRGEDFYTYQGFSRTISFGFKVVVTSEFTLKNCYDKLNILMSQVYPDYGDNNIMRVPLVRVTIGNYLYRVPGIIDSINVTIDQDTSWEINKDSQLPQIINVDVSFKPIMDTLPRKNKIGAINSPIINNSKIASSDLSVQPTAAAPDDVFQTSF